MPNKLKITYFFMRRAFLKAVGIFIGRSEIPAQGRYQKIIVYGQKRLGDMVISLPAFEVIRSRFKDAFIVLAATEYNKGVVEGRYFDEIVTQPSSFSEKRKFIALLKSHKFDIGIDLTCDCDIFPAYALYKAGVKTRIGYDVEGRGIFYTKPLPSAFKGKHAAELIMGLANAACGSCHMSLIVPRYEPYKDDIEYALDYFSKNNIKKPVIGVHPGAYFPSQIWPLERFAGVIDDFVRMGLAADVIIFGSSRDENLIERTMRSLKIARPALILNEPVKRLAAFIKQCDVFLCNNSGPLHLAAAMEVPTVSMMGPTDYDLWHPLGEKNVVIRKNTYCSPCNKAECEKHDCMSLITGDEVIGAIKRQLTCCRRSNQDG